MKHKNGGKWFLSCVGNDGIDVDCREANFQESDALRLRRDLARARDANNMIIECSFDIHNGVWRYYAARADKNKANYITTVFDTMENIAEGITLEELKYRLPLKPSTDDWEARLARARFDISKSQAGPVQKGKPTSSNPQKTQPTEYRPPAPPTNQPSRHQLQSILNTSNDDIQNNFNDNNNNNNNKRKIKKDNQNKFHLNA